MQELFIGQIIKERRKEQKCSQEKLCDDFMEPSTLSRIENGEVIPSHDNLKAILERLSLPLDPYFMPIDKAELEISNLKSEIITNNIYENSEKGLAALERLEEIAPPKNRFVAQFILRSRAILGKREGGIICPYSDEEKLEMLMRAIRITIPKFNAEEVDGHFYTVEELKLINCIAGVYSNLGQNKTAVDMYCQLLKYMKKNLVDQKERNLLLILVEYNYSRILCMEEQHKEAIEIANMGLELSIQERYSGYLGGFLTILAHSLYAQGKMEESKQNFYQAHCIYTVLRDEKNIRLAAQNLKDFFEIDI